MDPFILVALKFLALVFGFAYGITIVGRIVGAKQNVSDLQVFFFAISAAAFVTMQWLLPPLTR
jgi:hypothetical protein